MSKRQNENGKKGFFTSLFRSSIILTSIDRFTAYIYTLIKNGFFGYIFSGYDSVSRSGIGAKIRSTKLAHHLSELRYGICRHIEHSFLIDAVDRFAKYLLKCNLKVYGAFLFSFGLYTGIISFINIIRADNKQLLFTDPLIILAIVSTLVSFVLLLSKKNLSEALVSSVVGRFIIKITGYTTDNPALSLEHKGRASIAFLAGILAAFASHLIAPNNGPIFLILGLFAAICAYLVLLHPEIGVLALFFFTPLLPTMALAAIVIYTFICWLIKLFRGKRVLSIDLLDISVVTFTVILLSGGIISLSADSLKPALLMTCLILGFFLASQLLTKREWLVRCTTATVISGTLVSLYGILIYYAGAGYFSAAWLDDEMFSGISNRAVSTLENPNMLGEYLLMIIPIALVMLIGKGEGLRRLPSFVCIGALGVCMILTWSRGAWLALIIELIIFIMMWHHRSIWVIFAGICAIPILPSVLPASIVSRFTSIGNLSDSSTSYRVYIWRSSVKMIRDNFISGIGIGEKAWKCIYPAYAYTAVEQAPHSHNLFLQIWLELGVFGIIAFLAFIFLLLQASFTLFRRLSDNTQLTSSELTESMMKFNDSNGRDKHDAQRDSRIQLRLSVIGPLTGIIGVLIQGLTDYSWYNYRLYLFFWIMAGLCAAYIRNANSFISQNTLQNETESSSDKVFTISKRKESPTEEQNERT